MFKLKITWMLLVIKGLYHILDILDDLQEPYKRRSESIQKLNNEFWEVEKQLKEELK